MKILYLSPTNPPWNAKRELKASILLQLPGAVWRRTGLRRFSRSEPLISTTYTPGRCSRGYTKRWKRADDFRRLYMGITGPLRIGLVISNFLSDMRWTVIPPNWKKRSNSTLDYELSSLQLLKPSPEASPKQFFPVGCGGPAIRYLIALRVPAERVAQRN